MSDELLRRFRDKIQGRPPGRRRGTSVAAEGVMAEYSRLSKQHEKPAEKLWADVRRAFQDGNKEQGYKLSESSPGLYEHSAPALVMVGHWGLSFAISPPAGAPFTVLLVDRANG